ncbi:RHS repeat-associated protein [Luteibacter rhizovicinus]|uniref:RHS repeat-associated protein n=1 Tax=Luteibacter rhizovicinus TaxID=242606 RepID=A0A4R3YNQ1_9GAMM|nr:RHS repeat-associated core domain-containing protein [Luteibacter rhizovicinus]TCV93158.1 RHS repeat-associated protein [Luteibacter rhizovicinus]
MKPASIFLAVLALNATAICCAEEVTYYLTDPQGTPLAITDIAGNITGRLDHSPFGRSVLDRSEGVGYTGHVADPDTDFVYMQARYFDPSIGRFLSTDPKSAKAGDMFNFNRMAYANDNPMRFVDLDGREIRLTGSDDDKRQFISIAYLHWLSTEHMGLSPNKSRDSEIVKMLLDWRDHLG